MKSCDAGLETTPLTAAVDKGRDHMWTGAVDGLRVGQNVYSWPLYTGPSIPDTSWRDRMWLDTWV
ncbi:hypothetical protein ABZW26_15090 [Streptomyces sp. NPDC004623]|uniref:hypothetical protein n=1 Tax=Streptomyces sp. NPDC004623 TaxID=3156653 RepID=UPI0033AA7FC7